MLCFKETNSSWDLCYIYDGNSKFNPVTLESVPYIINRLPIAKAVKSSAFVKDFVVDSSNGIHCYDGLTSSIEVPVKFNGTWAANCIRIPDKDLASITQILANSGGEYYIFPKEIDTLVVKKIDSSSSVEYAKLLESKDEHRYWFEKEEDR